MSSIEDLQAWREPLSANWREQTAEVMSALKGHVEGASLVVEAGRLRRLAAMRLADRERLVMGRVLRAARRLRDGLPLFRRLRVLLVSNRTVGFFAKDLEVSGAARGLLIEAVVADYDAVAPLAFDPTYMGVCGVFDVVVLMLDAGWFVADAPLLDTRAEAQTVASFANRVEAIVLGLQTRFNAPTIVSTIPPPEDCLQSSFDRATPGTAVRILDGVNARLNEHATMGRHIPFDLASIAGAIGSVIFYDPSAFVVAKLPFSLGASPVVADRLSALLAALVGRSGRVLVLDLDNTLWGGVIADDGLEEIQLGQGSPIGEAFVDFQDHILDIRRRGVALAVCSKNVETIAREPFSAHTEMRLREDHFAVFVANFDDKATNLSRIADALALDTSSLVFVDDNPAEREIVRSTFPFVMVPEMGEDPALFRRILSTSGYFEHQRLTTDDIGRAEAYQARSAAQSLARTITDYESYLDTLEMSLSVERFDAVGRARIASLIQKSNQFNLTTRRYTESEVSLLERDPNRIGLQVRLRDRFADHGMIGVVIIVKHGSTWEIDTWIMSCRVLQRRVEYGTMDEVVRMASAAQADRLIGLFIPTARNGLVQNFFDLMGFHRDTHISRNDRGLVYSIAPSNWTSPVRLPFLHR